MYSVVLTLHRKKKVREFPVPSRDVTTKLSLGGNNDVITELFLAMGSLVSDIPAGDGKLVNLFLRCAVHEAWPFFMRFVLRYFNLLFLSCIICTWPLLQLADFLLCLALRYLSLTSSNNSDPQQQQQQQVKAESSQLTASAVYEVARPILQGCHAVQTRLVLHFLKKKYQNKNHSQIRMFLGLLDLDADPLVRGWIRILLSSCKNSTKNPDSWCFVTLFDFLSLKNDVNVPSKSISRKTVGILKVNDESSRIRIQDSDPNPNPDQLVRGMDPDPHQNVMDPQHWKAK